MKDWHDIGAIDEVRRAGRVITRVGGREIGVVVDEDGRPWAFRNRCPHHGAPLCQGAVHARATGTPGRYALGGARVLRCPWHGWEFDVETGRCPDDAAMRVATYPVDVRDGRVLVQA